MDNMKEACDVGRSKTRKRRCCDVGRWKMRKRRCRTWSSLPHEVIENILSRLPVKDLLRFRVVCKQWEATISDPTFAQIHLQQYSKNPYLLAWQRIDDFNGLHVGELQNNCIELVLSIEHPRVYDLRSFIGTLCSCDGLYLLCFTPRVKGKPKEYKLVLWNPSSRTYREVYFPESVDWKSVRTIRAMYYNPLMKDYKILITDLERYAVYSCRDNKWGDVKEMKGFSGDHFPQRSVSVNGSIYWLAVDLVHNEDYEDDEDDNIPDYIGREVICFDWKNETFKRLPLPNCDRPDNKYFQLISLGGQLCLFISDRVCFQVEIMKKVNGDDEWMESKEESLCECKSEVDPQVVCQLSENEILLHVRRNESIFYMVYNKSKNTLVEIHNNYRPTLIAAPLSKHLENLLLL